MTRLVEPKSGCMVRQIKQSHVEKLIQSIKAGDLQFSPQTLLPVYPIFAINNEVVEDIADFDESSIDAYKFGTFGK